MHEFGCWQVPVVELKGRVYQRNRLLDNRVDQRIFGMDIVKSINGRAEDYFNNKANTIGGLSGIRLLKSHVMKDVERQSGVFQHGVKHCKLKYGCHLGNRRT